MDVKSVAEQLFFTTVKVETINAEGVSGLATSFVFNFQSGEQQYPFLVTNRHVVGSARRGGLLFIKGGEGAPILGDGCNLALESFESMWFGHPDPEIDLVVTPLVPILEQLSKQGIQVFLLPIPNTLVPDKEALGKLDALEEVVFVGYPSGVWDRQNLLPVMRRGTTATPVAVDFQGKETFLIDAFVFPGSSGSPVFLYNAGMYHDKSGIVRVAPRLLFLGVISSVFYQADQIVMGPAPTAIKPTAVFKQMLGLGVVIKASKVLETVKAYLRSGEPKFPEHGVPE